MLVDSPAAGLKIFNRGVSGNKVYQLAERWQADCLDLKPNVLSILIGVNDYWHKHKHNYDGTLEKYEGDYRALIKRTKDALPEVRLILCEPFTLKVGAVDDTWFPGVRRLSRGGEAHCERRGRGVRAFSRHVRRGREGCAGGDLGGGWRASDA